MRLPKVADAERLSPQERDEPLTERDATSTSFSYQVADDNEMEDLDAVPCKRARTNEMQEEQLQGRDDGGRAVMTYEMQEEGGDDGDEMEEKFVFPWSGVLANDTPMKVSAIKDMLKEQNIGHEKVEHMSSEGGGFSGYTHIEFQSNWSGLVDALLFEKTYAAQHKDGRILLKLRRRRVRMVGWLALEISTI